MIQELWTLWTQVSPSPILEIIAVIFGIFSVWFGQKENILIFPMGIISTSIYVYICYKANLFAQSGINLYYTIVSFYGLYMWSRKDKNNAQLKISVLSRNNKWLLLVITIVIFVLLYNFIGLFTKNSQNLDGYYGSMVMYIDSFVASLCLIAMFLSARKKVENWIFWIIADLISIPLFIMQGLYFTVIQFVIFLVLAVMGFVKWRRKYIISKTEINQ
ncbi:MAG: nicotinamide riboside transporter PnuC [Bacteroidales bacterium]|jgi:nicotinamide mononucleotide transporter